jgi:pimeloyl-ACP methyl ester carboxylesterase
LTRPERNHLIWGSAAAGVGLLTAGVLGQRRFRRQIADDPEQAVLSEPPHGAPLSITSPDGTVLHAEAFGPQDGLPVVLAHGWTESLQFWIYQIRGLSQRGFRVIAYDLRGHGESQPAVQDDYSIERFGEDLDAVLAQAVSRGRRAVIAGHSLGAMAIAAWARRHDVRARATATALINTGVGDLIAEQLLVPVPAFAQAINRTIAVHGILGSHAPLPRFSTPLTASAIRYIAFGPAATPAQVAFFERMLIACPPDVRAHVGISLSELALSDALPCLTVPTTVIAGEKDRLTPPAHARRIAEMLPALERLIVLENTGHMAPLERHEAVTEALVALAQSPQADALDIDGNRRSSVRESLPPLASSS